MFTTPEPSQIANSLQTGDLPKRKRMSLHFRRGWYRPPIYDPAKRYERAQWWVEHVGANLSQSALDYASLIADPTSTERDRRRARAVVAADRALFTYWVGRWRQIARYKQVPRDTLAQDAQGVLTRLGAVGQAIGPPLDVAYAEGVVRAIQRQPHMEVVCFESGAGRTSG